MMWSEDLTGGNANSRLTPFTAALRVPECGSKEK